MLLQLIDVPHWFLINMFLRVTRVGFQSVFPGSGAKVWPEVKVNGAYYCDALLLKQLLNLLRDMCQAAGDFCFSAHHACARALSCCDARLRTQARSQGGAMGAYARPNGPRC